MTTEIVGAGWVEAGAAVAALVVAAVALISALRSNRISKSDFLSEQRQNWEALADDWATVLLLLNGHDFYYSDAPDTERRRIAALEAGIKSGRTDQSAIRPEARHVRRIAKFFAGAADALMRGDWSVHDAYALFGPDVARHYATLLWLSRRRTKRPKGPGDFGWPGAVDQLPEFSFFDEQDALYVLAWVMRAEQCRRGDTYPHFIVALAEEMRAGEYAKTRAILKRACRNRGRLWTRRELTHLLRLARTPSVQSAYGRDPDPIIKEDNYYLFRRPWMSKRGVRNAILHSSRRARSIIPPWSQGA